MAAAAITVLPAPVVAVERERRGLRRVRLLVERPRGREVLKDVRDRVRLVVLERELHRVPLPGLDLEVPQVRLVQPNRIDVVREFLGDGFEQAGLVRNDVGDDDVVVRRHGFDEVTGMVEVGKHAVGVGDVPAVGDVFDPPAARAGAHPKEWGDLLEVAVAGDAQRRLVGKREELNVLVEAIGSLRVVVVRQFHRFTVGPSPCDRRDQPRDRNAPEDPLAVPVGVARPVSAAAQPLPFGSANFVVGH